MKLKFENTFTEQVNTENIIYHTQNKNASRGSVMYITGVSRLYNMLNESYIY